MDFKREDTDYNVSQLEVGIEKLMNTDIATMEDAILQSVDEFRDSVIADKWRKLIDEL